MLYYHWMQRNLTDWAFKLMKKQKKLKFKKCVLSLVYSENALCNLLRISSKNVHNSSKQKITLMNKKK